MISLSRTLLPTPAGPSRMRVSRGSHGKADVLKHRRPVEASRDVAQRDNRAGVLRRSRRLRRGHGSVAHVGKMESKHVRDEEVDGDDQHGRGDHRRNRGAANALGASGGSHAVEAADGAEDVAEEERLHQALDDVGIAKMLVGRVEVLRAVLMVHETPSPRRRRGCRMRRPRS